MKYMLRPIISNILLFIESLLFFSIAFILALKITVLNENSVIKQMKKTNYYEKVNEEIKDTMKYITRKSGYKDYIVDEVISEEDVKNDINKFVRSIYKKEELQLNTEHLKENITINLEKYLEEKNITKTDTEKNTYINKIISTYKNEISLMHQMNDISDTISKTNTISNSLLLIFIIDLIALIIINKKVFNKKEYHVLALASALSLIGTNIFIKTLNIKNLFIYNNTVSEVIKRTLNKVSQANILFTVLCIIIGIVLYKFANEDEKI